MNHLRPAQHCRRPTCAAGSRWRASAAPSRPPPHRRRAAHRERPRPLQHPQRRHLPVASRRLSRTRAAPAVRAADRRYRVSPLGHDLPLFNRPGRRGRDHASRRARSTCPAADRAAGSASNWRALLRRAARTPPAPVDNADPSLVLYVDGARSSATESSHLQPGATTARPGRTRRRPTASTPSTRCSAASRSPADAARCRRTFASPTTTAVSADIGGGEYERGESLPRPPRRRRRCCACRTTTPRSPPRSPRSAGDGVVEITDSGRYEETLTIAVAADGARRAPRRGTVPADPGAGRRTRPSPAAPTAPARSNGLLIAGQRRWTCPPRQATQLARLQPRPLRRWCRAGRSTAGGRPAPADRASLAARHRRAGDRRSTAAIVGALRSHERARVSARDSHHRRHRARRRGLCRARRRGARRRALARRLHGDRQAARGRGGTDLQQPPARARWPPATRWPRRCARRASRPAACASASCPSTRWCRAATAASPIRPPMRARIAPRFTSLRYGTPPTASLRGSTADRDPARRRRRERDGRFPLTCSRAQRETNLRIRLRRVPARRPRGRHLLRVMTGS